MRRTYVKNTLRTIKGTFGRFAAIFAIVALGVGFLAGLLSSTPDMRLSFDKYFDESSMYDIRILGDMGFTAGDVEKLRELDSVESVQAGYIADALMSSGNGSDFTVRLLSYDGGNHDSMLNRPLLSSGRLPASPDECVVVNAPFTSSAKLKLGDTLEASAESENEDELLSSRAYTVVGFVDYCPYFSSEKEYTNIGSGTIDLFLLAPNDSFKTDVFTEINISVKCARDLLSTSEEYEALVNKTVNEIESISGVRCDTRYNEILGEAADKVSDAKTELANAKRDADSKLSDAQSKLSDGQEKIKDGEAQLSDAQAQIDKNESELNKNESDLNDKEKAADEQFVTAEKQLEDSQSELDSKKANADKERADAEAKLAAYKLSSGQLSSVNVIRKLCAKYPTLADDMAALQKKNERVTEIGIRLTEISKLSDAERAAYADEEASLTQEKSELRAEIAKITASAEYTEYSNAVSALATSGADYNTLAPLALKLGALDNAAAQLVTAQSQIDTQRSELKSKEESTTAQLAEARQKIADGRAQLENAKKELSEQLSTLNSSKSKLSESQGEYNDAKDEAEQKIADGEQKISEAEGKISEIETPEWHVYTRADNNSYVSIKANIDKVDAIAKVFPFFFFLIAALVASTTMNRMIEDERLQIGTMKALGYSKTAIMGKYVIYALAASVLGSVFGVAVGYRVFPSVIWNAYSMMYELPDFVCPLNWTYALSTSAGVTLCILLVTLNSCRATLREKPSQLMLPKAPKAGKRVLLERVTFIWSHMRFTHKVTARNIFRYKKRFFMTVIGVAGCTALLVTGFGMRDSFNDIADKQYGELCTYNVYAPITGEEALDNVELQSMLNDSGTVSGYTAAYLENVTLSYGDKSFDVYTFIPKKASDFNGYMNFRTMSGGKPISFDEGSVILTQKASEKLGVKAGDTVSLTDMDGETASFKISGISENYVANYIYMSEGTFKAAMGHEEESNMLAIRLADSSADAQSAFGKQLLETDAVGGVTFTSNSKAAVARALENINLIVLVIIFCAGALALVVLYNLTNINISERIKEIATIKVLGFTDREVNAYVNRESIILSLIGTLIGLVLGIFLHRYVMGMAEMDTIIFGRTVKSLSFVYSAVLTMAFSIFVDLVLQRKLRRISMVESMKAPEQQPKGS